jgi:hypothetical protein
MYVFEEMINGKKLTEIINETHENVKYLPGHKLPENIVSFMRGNKICNQGGDTNLHFHGKSLKVPFYTLLMLHCC